MSKRTSISPVRLRATIMSMVLVAGFSSVLAEPLPAPDDLEVRKSQNICSGRWTPVKGASFYEVWVRRFGQWSFDKRDINSSPFTSSFDLVVDDERALFKVRAIANDGEAGEYSDEVAPSPGPEPEEASNPVSGPSRTQISKSADFDPKAPAPKPPSGLFSIWVESSTIKLVWREVEGASSYTVEEFIDESWVSAPKLTFSSENTAMIKDHPAPGPYKFRVRSVGANGRASEPSRDTTVRR